jgi:hypothetical protein
MSYILNNLFYIKHYVFLMNYYFVWISYLIESMKQEWMLLLKLTIK